VFHLLVVRDGCLCRANIGVLRAACGRRAGAKLRMRRLGGGPANEFVLRAANGELLRACDHTLLRAADFELLRARAVRHDELLCAPGGRFDDHVLLAELLHDRTVRRDDQPTDKQLLQRLSVVCVARTGELWLAFLARRGRVDRCADAAEFGQLVGNGVRINAGAETCRQ
jgi:hypothetical protein